MTNRWYTIQILPQFQSTADFHLRRQHFQPFFPQIELKRSKIQPLFKGYGFVKFDLHQDQWLSINGTRGVIALLPKKRLHPCPMADGFVEYLQEHDPIKEKDFEDIFERFYPGIAVTVRDGLLEGRTGRITNIRGTLLEISFRWDHNVRNAIWIDRESVVTAHGIQDLDP